MTENFKKYYNFLINILIYLCSNFSLQPYFLLFLNIHEYNLSQLSYFFINNSKVTSKKCRTSYSFWAPTYVNSGFGWLVLPKLMFSLTWLMSFWALQLYDCSSATFNFFRHISIYLLFVVIGTWKLNATKYNNYA